MSGTAAERVAGADASGVSGHLPALLSGGRRRLLALLVLAGVVQAVAAGVTVVVLTRGLQARTAGGQAVAVGLLVVVAVVVGWTRSRERVLGERLGQDYVHEIRLGLVRQVLDGHRRGSLGTTLTRASNDLNAVRNWVALGIAPLAVGVPLLVGCAVVLATIHVAVALAVLLPLTVLGVTLWSASREAYEQSARVRRERGRLAGHLADTLTATTAIRSAGGGYRELKRLDRRSAKVVEAAIDRARVIGRIRGSAAAAGALATATVIAASMFADLGGARLAAALTVLGLMSAPVQDLGRVVEYRQSFRAARAVLLPALSSARPRTARPTPTAERPADSGAAYYRRLPFVVEGLRLADAPDEEVPALYARAGDRVVLQGADRALTRAVLEAVVGLRTPLAGSVRVDGTDVRTVGYRERRRLLGYAAQGMLLERTTVARAVRYRHPESDPADVEDMLARVGLVDRVAALPGGERARLTQGGDPLAVPDRARLLLARALFGDPPLLVLDHLDAELGEHGRRQLRAVLADYPGVVLLASDDPEAVMTPNRRWRVGEDVGTPA
jgi:ABC-type multidrug transport system fused ATPase/permease subunit